MARLPAKPTAGTDGLSPLDVYTKLTAVTGDLRHIIKHVFLPQIAAQGSVPLSHVMDRLIEPLLRARIGLNDLIPMLMKPEVVGFVKSASGDNSLNPADEVNGLIGDINAALVSIRSAVSTHFPDSFDASGNFLNPITNDATGRTKSVLSLTKGQADDFGGDLAAVLARIAD